MRHLILPWWTIVLAMLVCTFSRNVAFGDDALNSFHDPLKNFYTSLSYPIETLQVLAVERIQPGPAYQNSLQSSLQRLESERQAFLNNPKYSSPRDKYEINQTYDQTIAVEIEKQKRIVDQDKVKRIFLDKRNGKRWERVDEIFLPKDQYKNVSQWDSQFSQSTVRVLGPRGYSSLAREFNSGMIHDKEVSLIEEFWNWGEPLSIFAYQFRGKNRDVPVAFDVFVERFVLGEFNRFWTIRHLSDSGPIIRLTDRINDSTFDLDKDWNYALRKSTIKGIPKKKITEVVTVRSRIPLDNGRFLFPTHLIREVYEPSGQLKETVELIVLKVEVWIDIPQYVFNYPFRKGSMVRDYTVRERPRDITWGEDEYFYDTFDNVSYPSVKEVTEEIDPDAILGQFLPQDKQEKNPELALSNIPDASAIEQRQSEKETIIKKPRVTFTRVIILFLLIAFSRNVISYIVKRLSE